MQQIKNNNNQSQTIILTPEEKDLLRLTLTQELDDNIELLKKVKHSASDEKIIKKENEHIKSILIKLSE